MSSKSVVKLVSECFIKPIDDLSPEQKQPIHLTPFELPWLNIRYNQKGLLFAKPPSPDFSITIFLDDLQHSLSATLIHFYPLAARLATQKQQNPPSYVIYLDPSNTPGVKFVYATTDATISDVLSPPHVPLVLVHSFFDLSEAISHDGHMLPVLSVQVTELADGVFIGCSINHMVADGSSFWHFMATWSEMFRSKRPAYHHGSISPPCRPLVLKRWVLDGSDDPVISLPFTHHDQFVDRVITQPLVSSRFFHFSSKAISKLKATANSECDATGKIISSLQAVIALTWRCITRARCLPHDGETSCSFMVSTRRRLNPPLSDDYFGNPIQAVRAKATVGDLLQAHGLGWAAFLLHEAVINHDDKAIKASVESWIRSPLIYKMSQNGDSNGVHVGSSPRFDVYGCEFGLGKAVAVRSGGTYKSDGLIGMYPGRECGGSMEVEVCLFPENMKNLESDQEFASALAVN